MSGLAQRIEEDLKSAMKAREALAVSVLRLVKAAISNAAIQKGKLDLEEPELLDLLGKLIRQRDESIAAYTQAGRAELALKEAEEKKILQRYLPPALSEEELRALVRAAVQELGASGPSALGAVMKAVMPRVAGRADGKRINQLVREVLG